MLELITKQSFLVTAMIIIAGVGVVMKFVAWLSLGRLESATDNMGNSKNALTRQIKLKFENCYKLNLDIRNIPAFVERYVLKYKVFGVGIEGYRKSNQICAVLMGMLCICGCCLQYINGFDGSVILKCLLAGIIGQLVLLLTEIIFETRTKRDRIIVNLEEYLENILSRRLQLEYDDIEVKPLFDDIQNGRNMREGRAQMAATKVKMKKPRAEGRKASEEEEVIRSILKEYLY